ncbi:4542_t:CDS:2 [Ambispora leptoticha]|uniref:4542_t:CDS:1 n=1 Tax=Ambispora leptoticha TaxID=144679 RepID=A0A9N9A762_9GLOM|nr:4542_t:CDS:2 [Ambispora leptoticha]
MSFSYLSGESKIYSIATKNFRVKIETLNEDIARLFFVNKENNEPIDFPDNMVFRNTTTNTDISPTVVKDKESYLVTWMYSYELFENSKIIFKLEHKREQIGSDTSRSLAEYFELLNRIASLEASINKSVHEFDVIVSPKRTKGFKWTVNIEQATFEALKDSIRAVYQTPALENNGAVFNVNNLKFIVFIETPSKAFSDWTLGPLLVENFSDNDLRSEDANATRDNENDDEFSDNNKEEDDDGFCGFSDDDDEGYYYDLNAGKTYTKSEYRYSIRAY